jgi:hypothetical protein
VLRPDNGSRDGVVGGWRSTGMQVSAGPRRVILITRALIVRSIYGFGLHDVRGDRRSQRGRASCRAEEKDLLRPTCAARRAPAPPRRTAARATGSRAPTDALRVRRTSTDLTRPDLCAYAVVPVVVAAVVSGSRCRPAGELVHRR